MKKQDHPVATLFSALFSAALFLSLLSGIASAGGLEMEQQSPVLFPASAFLSEPEAALQAGSMKAPAELAFPPPTTPHISSFSTARAHKFMGYGTVLLAGLAAVSHSSHDFHRAASYGATWLASATCATGFSGYKGFIDLTDGLSVYDTHAILGAAGTIGFAATLVMAEADSDGNHDSIGAASAAAMGLSVVVLKIRW